MSNFFNEGMYKNPIIPGSHSDPSICRVGEDYYLVNSTFEFFPAIPVYHSKDLVHWELLCNSISREEQGLDLSDVYPSMAGIQAATIRYHEGIFYIISTRLNTEWPHHNHHFIITATNPAGPWSECHWIEGAPGIDSSLFFDEDGKCYFHANREKTKKGGANTELWCQEIDLNTFTLKGESHALWDGTGGAYPEGPHIYKRNGYYYLMIAEGGTGPNHTVSMARSKHIFGPYESNPRNPLLSHKHLHKSYPIICTGHADLVETQNGEWWMVCLANTYRGRMLHEQWNGLQDVALANLGRETFLVPCVWEDDLGPIVAPDSGRVELFHKLPNLKPYYFKERPSCIQFDSEELDPRLLTTHIEYNSFYSLSANKGNLRLYMGKDAFKDYGDVHELGLRVEGWCYSASTKLAVSLKDNEECGLSIYQNYMNSYRLAVKNENGHNYLRYIEVINKEEKTLKEINIDNYDLSAGIILTILQHDRDLNFYFGASQDKQEFVINRDSKMLAPAIAGGYQGNWIMLYASSNGKESDGYADFNYLEMNYLDK